MTQESPGTASGADASAELAQVRLRLAEAEELLNAIRNGEVDALMVSGARGEQVYTLSSADRVYRLLVETMREGAVTLSADGVILFCNAYLAQMLGLPAEQIPGSALRDYLPHDDWGALEGMLANCGTGISRGEINLMSSAGALVPAYVSAFEFRVEETNLAHCLVIADLREQNELRQILAAEQVAGSIHVPAAEDVSDADEQGRRVRASPAAPRCRDGGWLSNYQAQTFVAALAVVTGAMVLAGWALDIAALKSVLPGWVSMKPNTALGFILIGIALFPSAPATLGPGLASFMSGFTRLCGLLAALIGALTLGEYLFAWDAGIDPWLFAEPAGTVGTSTPGRMAPDTALCFVLLAAAREMARSGGRTKNTLLAAAVLGLLVTIIAAADILTYFTPVLGAFGWWGETIMAVPTAAVFAVLGASVLWEAWQKNVSMWALSRTVTAGFALGLALLVVAGLTASRTQEQMRMAKDQEVHSETLLRQIARVEAAVASTQNHTRGYLLTGDAAMLRSHAVAEAASKQALDALRLTAAGSPTELAQFSLIRPPAEESLQWFRQMIDARRSGVGIQPGGVRHGEDLMQAFRAAVDAAERAGGERLLQSKADAQRLSQFVYAIIAGGMMTSLSILIAALLWLNQGEAARNQARAQLELGQRAKAAAFYARSLLEASLDPLLTINPAGKITDVNEAAVRATGVGRAELIGSDFASYFADPAKANASYRQALAEGSVTGYALAIRHSSGKITDVLYNASVYRDSSGKVAGVFAAARDVSELRKAEELLIATEQRLDLALRHSGMGVWDLDLIHDTAWRTLQHDRIFGYESAPATWGQEIALRHVVPEDREHFVRCFQEASGTGLFFLECRVIHPDQSIHWIQAQGQVLAYEEGRPARMLGTVVDITLQRAAQDALEQSARSLARSNADLEQFAYIASHDLQEPLRMVVGFVQLLEKRLAGKLDAETREFIGYAVDGAMRMQGLIEDILAYSRVTTQAQPFASVDSGEALQEALQRLAIRIVETGAEVHAQSLPVVMADHAQLVQLLQNLISNAIKFCKDRAPNVRVEAVHEAKRWRFSVTDNGIGIAPEYRGQLFVIFKRLHTRREYPGSGIGLAICKRIVERHGGEIGIDSAPAGGTVIWFTLPEEKSP